ncbi:hypothetical protein [Roseibium sp. RKSG952]|uniref:hypothetical protein n=1 Tax=Roseibium sp. RKSG952 TaxID=2529384 RepID=UPI0012BD7AE0|nr:hypothetical protein [Roseibium sp. RKSG952]MTI00040.1 hypothetical protein [Roseibium sp. RKSG952]
MSATTLSLLNCQKKGSFAPLFIVKLFLVTVFFPLTPDASAQEQLPSLADMTCAQAQQMVKSRGQVVMMTGPETFDRFVADAEYCDSNIDFTIPHFATTKDNAKCNVGKRCTSERTSPGK